MRFEKWILGTAMVTIIGCSVGMPPATRPSDGTLLLPVSPSPSSLLGEAETPKPGSSSAPPSTPFQASLACFSPIPDLDPDYEGIGLGDPCRGGTQARLLFWGFDGKPLRSPVEVQWYLLLPREPSPRVGLYPWPQWSPRVTEPQTDVNFMALQQPMCGVVATEVHLPGGVTRRRTTAVPGNYNKSIRYDFGSEEGALLSEAATFGLSSRPEIEWVRALATDKQHLTLRLALSEPFDATNAARLVAGLRLFTLNEVYAMRLEGDWSDTQRETAPFKGQGALSAAWNGERDRLTLTFPMAEQAAQTVWYLGLVGGADPVVDQDKLSLGLGYGDQAIQGPPPGMMARSVFLRGAWKADGSKVNGGLELKVWALSHDMLARVEWPPTPCVGVLDPISWPGAWRRPMEEEFLGGVVATPTPEPWYPPVPSPSPWQSTPVGPPSTIDVPFSQRPSPFDR